MIYDFVRSRGALLASQNLLLYRALSDAGIAMRFLLYRSFNKQLCGEFSCGLDGTSNLLVVSLVVLNTSCTIALLCFVIMCLHIYITP